MKVYKLTVMIIDHDKLEDDIVSELENASFPNDCINPKVVSFQSAEIGDWHDDHLLNNRDTWEAEFNRLFKKLE
jgi:hypothetical protein